MQTIRSLHYEENADQSNRFAKVSFDADVDPDIEITLNGTDNNGQFVYPNFVAIDNYTNDVDVEIHLDDIESTVASFTKVIWQINPLVSILRLSAESGEITIWVSEKKLPVGEGINENGRGSLASNVLRTNSRAGIAAIASTKKDMAVFLTEPGRRGLFSFDDADYSAHVAADPNQGIFVAPASDATGGTGAWIRYFEDALKPEWFGAKGDGIAIDYNAWVFLRNFLKFSGQNGFGYNKGVLGIKGGLAVYNFDVNTLDFDVAPRMIGFGAGGASGGASVIKTNKVTAIRIQSNDTVGAAGTQAVAVPHVRGNETIIDGWLIDCGYTGGAESEAHGIHLRGEATIRNVLIQNCPGDGIYAVADEAGAIKGNANGATIDKVFTQNCRNGIYIQGGDTNVINVSSYDGASNRQWNAWTRAFLGGSFPAMPQVAGGARTVFNDGVTVPCSYCTNGLGQWFFCVPGQEAFCAANAPPNTATSNTGWHFWTNGGAAQPATGVIDWSAGKTWRGGGGYFIQGDNNATVLDNPYAEIDQINLFDLAAGCVGMTDVHQYSWRWNANAILGAVGEISGIDFYGGSNQFRNKMITFGRNDHVGDVQNFGPITGATDLTINLNNTSSDGGFWAWISGILKGYLRNINGKWYHNGQFGHQFRYNNADILGISATGLPLVESAAASVVNPNAGFQELFIDTADHKLKRKDSAGVVTIIN